MQALILDQPGTVDTLRVDSQPDPQPGDGEIRVRVAAAGLNPVDYKLAGRGNPAWRFPHILGLDVAGTVEAIGKGVDQWAAGDRVFYHGDLSKPGGFAERAITTAHTVARIPDSVSFVDAVQAAVDADNANQGVEVLAFGGGISCIAGLPTLSEQTFAKSISLHRISLGAAHQSNNREAQLDFARIAAEMIALVADKKIDPMVEQVIPLDQIPDALAQLEGRHVRGKIVATLSDGS